MKKIYSSDRCSYCDHWSGDDNKPFVIISKTRFEWLVKAAKMLENMDGDDDWVDWCDDGNRLSRRGE